MSCHAMSCHVMSCSCHVMSCHVMSCHVMSCHVMSCHTHSYLYRARFGVKPDWGSELDHVFNSNMRRTATVLLWSCIVYKCMYISVVVYKCMYISVVVYKCMFKCRCVNKCYSTNDWLYTVADLGGGGPQGAMAPPNGLKKKIFLHDLKIFFLNVYLHYFLKYLNYPPSNFGWKTPSTTQLPPPLEFTNLIDNPTSKSGRKLKTLSTTPPRIDEPQSTTPPSKIGRKTLSTTPPSNWRPERKFAPPPQIQFLDPPLIIYEL